MGAESVLFKYLQQLSKQVIEVMVLAAELAATSSKHFYIVASILKDDTIGMYFIFYLFIIIFYRPLLDISL